MRSIGGPRTAPAGNLDAMTQGGDHQARVPELEVLVGVVITVIGAIWVTWGIFAGYGIDAFSALVAAGGGVCVAVGLHEYRKQQTPRKRG